MVDRGPIIREEQDNLDSWQSVAATAYRPKRPEWQPPKIKIPEEGFSIKYDSPLTVSFVDGVLRGSYRGEEKRVNPGDIMDVKLEYYTLIGGFKKTVDEAILHSIVPYRNRTLFRFARYCSIKEYLHPLVISSEQ